MKRRRLASPRFRTRVSDGLSAPGPARVKRAGPTLSWHESEIQGARSIAQRCGSGRKGGFRRANRRLGPLAAVTVDAASALYRLRASACVENFATPLLNYA